MSFSSGSLVAVLLLACSLASAANGRFLLQEGRAPPPVGGTVADLDCVRVNEVVHKPEDQGDVKGVDFIELYNACEMSVNLAGWSVADEKENSFILGQNSCDHTIDALSRLVLYRSSDCSFEFGFGGVDQVTLRDATGDIMDQVGWGKDNANRGYSWSRIPDGSGTFQDGKPTAGQENTV